MKPASIQGIVGLGLLVIVATILRSRVLGAAASAPVPGAASRPDAPQTLLVIEPTREHPRNSEGDVIALRDGALLLAYSRFNGGAADNSSSEICCRQSRDAGRSWSPDRLLVANEGRENVMSVSLLRLKTGEILLFYLRKNGWNDCNLYVRRSRDELATLGEPLRVTTRPGYHVVNNARVVQLSSGRIVAPAALHPCPDGTEKTFSAHGIPIAYFSDDDGRSWSPDAAHRQDAGAAQVDPPPKRDVVLQEPGLIELPDGRLWMWMRTKSGTQFESLSTDRGRTWSEPRPGPLASPCSPASIRRIPWSGALLAVWNDHRGPAAGLKEKRTPLSVAVSRDDGRTWSPSRAIETDPDGCYCYTAITFVGERAILAYCAGNARIGGLNRLKVLALPRTWIDQLR